MAGLPCWDMSLAGKRLQENGVTVGCFLTHAKRHVELETPLVIVENTKDRTYISLSLVLLMYNLSNIQSKTMSARF